MARKGELALEAMKTLFAPLSVTFTGMEVVRNPESELPVDGDARIKLVVRDGTTGEPDISLSPLSFAYEHNATLALSVAKIGADDADALFDSIVDAIADLLEDDPTLGGLVDWAELGALDTDEVDEAVLAGFKAAIIPVTLYYTTDRALG